MSVVVVVGNPQAGSRTLRVASLAGQQLAALLGDAEVVPIDLAEHTASLSSWGDPNVAALKAQVLAARALVIASPTYKAAYTGLLKLFIDQFDRSELAGVPTVALMTGGSAAHSLAVEVHLAPVLVEIGASLPTRGIYVFGDAIDDPAPVLEAWWQEAEPVMRRALT